MLTLKQNKAKQTDKKKPKTQTHHCLTKSIQKAEL